MRLLGIEIRITIKVEATLLYLPAPGPGASGRLCYASSIVGSTAGHCGDQGAGRPGQGAKLGLGLGFAPWPE